MPRPRQSARRKFLRKYQQFCANPLRGAGQIRAELQILADNPDVASLGFYDAGILMVGLKPLIISYGAKRYDIGELIIYLIRHRTGRIWETSFGFENITRTLPDGGCDLMHPHIMSCQDHPYINGKIGELCISSGQFGVYQYLRRGEVHLTVARLLEILRTYGTGTPYLDIEHWPELKE